MKINSLLAGVVRVGVLAGFVALFTLTVVAIEWLVEIAVERHAAVLEVLPAVRHALVADMVFEMEQKLQIMLQNIKQGIDLDRNTP
jgi:hypothetical protein